MTKTTSASPTTGEPPSTSTTTDESSPSELRAEVERLRIAEARERDLRHISEAEVERLRGKLRLAEIGEIEQEARAEDAEVRLRKVEALAANARKHSGGSFTAQVDALSIERALAEPAEEAPRG